MPRSTRQPPPPPDDNLVDIDKYRLDWEWARQPGLIEDAVREQTDREAELTEAKNLAELAKYELEAVWAKVTLKVRKNPAVYTGTDDPKEKGIEAAVLLDKDYQAAHARLMAAKAKVVAVQRQYGYAEARTKAVEHRKPAIADIVRLFLAGYFGGQGKPVTEAEAEAYLDQRVKASARRGVATN